MSQGRDYRNNQDEMRDVAAQMVCLNICELNELW